MSDPEPDPPTVGAPMEGWREVERYVETVFELAAASVHGHTAVYEDRTVTEAAINAGLADQPWRFLFVTRLSFTPPLAPGVGPASVYPTVVSEATRSFAEDLRERGFESVERGRGERVRTDAGDRARLRRYTAVYRPAGGDTFDVEGWLAVWIHAGEFRVAGGAYPTQPLGDGTSAVVEPSRFRNELLDLIRAVE